MKKIILALLVLGAVAGAFLAFRQPEPIIAASPGDFLPDPGDQRAALLVHARDMASIGQGLAERVRFLEDLAPSDERAMLDALAFKLTEVAPHFGESVWLASFGMDEEIPDLTAAFVVRAEEPEPFLKDLFVRTLERFPTFTMEPLEADLPEPALPLVRIRDDDSGLLIYTALFPAEPDSVLLAATSRDSLKAMMRAFEDSSKRFTVQREVEGALFVGLSIPPQALLEIDDFPQEEVPEVPLVVQMAFDNDEKALEGRFFSNGYTVLATEQERKLLAPLGGQAPLVGRGTLIGLASGRVAGLTEEALIEEMANAPEGREALESVEEMERFTGLTLADVVDLLNGRVSLVLAGSALTPFGEVPGAYLLLEPDRAGVAARVARAVLELLPLPANPEKTSAPGWSEVYGIDVMGTFTLAADENRFLAGLLDARQMTDKPSFPEGLQGLIEPGHYGVFGLSFVELERAVDDLARRLGLFLQDPRFRQGIEAFHRFVAPLDTFTMKATSPEQGRFTLTYRETPPGTKEVQ